MHTLKSAEDYCRKSKPFWFTLGLMKSLANIVQHNCHISDARFAGNYTLCIYLLKMREYYRWEQNIPYTTKLSYDQIGSWLAEKEGLWDDVEENDYQSLHLENEIFDPFDNELVNQQLEQHKLIYSGGYASYGKPVFFLAELERKTVFEDYTLYIAGHELARDLTAPPGMASNKTIFIRKESLRRFIWEKFEESHWHKQENPLARALACYDFHNQPEQSLENMASMETDTVLHHEIGEIQASKVLGDAWDKMVMDMPRSQIEFMARAIKDHIADAVCTLPRLIENREDAQIHFYFANFTAMRKLLFPSLYEAYQVWQQQGSISALEELTERSKQHWTALASQMLDIFDASQVDGYSEMQVLIETNYL